MTRFGEMITTGRTALVLGAGFVSDPVIDYLTRDGSVSVTVGQCSVVYMRVYECGERARGREIGRERWG